MERDKNIGSPRPSRATLKVACPCPGFSGPKGFDRDGLESRRQRVPRRGGQQFTPDSLTKKHFRERTGKQGRSTQTLWTGPDVTSSLQA
jgi:hypothetical protein